MLMRLRGGAAWGEGARERDHFDEDGPVVVLAAGQGMSDGEYTAQFFLNFPVESLFGRFARFDFAARELPFQAEVFMAGALGEQDLAMGIGDDCADDEEGMGRGIWRVHAEMGAKDRSSGEARIFWIQL